MFHSRRALSLEPSFAELADTITSRVEISVDCAEYGCSRSSEWRLVPSTAIHGCSYVPCNERLRTLSDENLMQMQEDVRWKSNFPI